MSLDAAIREIVLGAVRDALPELRAELGRPRLISIRELPVSHRLVLEAERAGEIRVYRRGKFSAVDEAEFTTWVKRAPACVVRKIEPAPVLDEIDEIIASNDVRRKRGGRIR
jgi:hypothetical protein